MMPGVRPRWDFLSTISGLFRERKHSAPKKLAQASKIFIVSDVKVRHHTP